jgi:hypothetical protein
MKWICALFLPPLGVAIAGGDGKDFGINLILTILGYIPGIIHAFWVCANR